MSSLTSKVKMCWRAVMYNRDDHLIYEGPEYYTKVEAIDDAAQMVQNFVDRSNSYVYAKVECVVVPLYE